MANITLHLPNRHLADTTWGVYAFGAQTSTVFEMLDQQGRLREVDLGKNFTYGSNGFFSGGTINTTYIFTTSGVISYSATGLAVDVATRNSKLSVGDSGYNYEQYVMAGNDTITGSSGDDLLAGSSGNDKYDGGAGTDLFSFRGYGYGVTVNLLSGTVRASTYTSTIANVEDVDGTSLADTLTGNARANVLQGLGGNDTLDGGAGFDTAAYQEATSAVTVSLAAGTATGGAGSDTLSGIERVVGSRFNDTLTGSAAKESFLGGFGNDTIDGGGGIDTAEYGFVGTGVTVNLATGTTSGGAGVDTLSNIENVLGSIFADTLSGDARANQLAGNDGNDTLFGAGGADQLLGDAGNDLLRGGTGNDVLTGGAGKDIFRFDSALSTATVQNLDRISDFSVRDDTIQLDNAVFTALGGNGALNAAFFRANATGLAADANDYLVYETDTGKLFYDADGSGAGAAVQVALLGANLALTAADFAVM